MAMLYGLYESYLIVGLRPAVLYNEVILIELVFAEAMTIYSFPLVDLMT